MRTQVSSALILYVFSEHGFCNVCASSVYRAILQPVRVNIGSLTEGVETREQYRMLSEMGCRMFQGYYFSKPLPEEEFEQRFL